MAAANHPAAFAQQDCSRKKEPAMHVSKIGKDQRESSQTNATWERSMDTSMQSILEILEENVNWWEQAAISCEQAATRLPTGEKEGWQLMGAVYRERADKHARLVAQMRQANMGRATSPVS
jgi:hypothetical protein